MQAPAEVRFWLRVARSDSGCWLWTGSQARGYGRLYVNGRMVQAHRFAYELLVGPVPDALGLDHLCRVRACVNPAHLDPVSNRENVLRGDGPTAQNARKAVCLRGHSFDFVSDRGKRVCRACYRERARMRVAA